MQLKPDDDAILLANFVNAVSQALSRFSMNENRKITVVFSPITEDDSRMFTPISPRGMKGLTQSSAYTSSYARGDVQTLTQDQSLHSNLAPVCYSSNSSCVEATNNCSGHGSCYLKYGSGDETAPSNCYACQCRQTVVRNSDGTVRKVQWGGPACQKRDISSPFFLIAGVSVMVITLVSSAIGMLFSMGRLDLPSVIGAGVDGSKART